MTLVNDLACVNRGPCVSVKVPECYLRLNDWPSVELGRQPRVAPVREHEGDVAGVRAAEGKIRRDLGLVEPAMTAGFDAGAWLAAFQRANEKQPRHRIRRRRIRLTRAIPDG